MTSQTLQQKADSTLNADAIVVLCFVLFPSATFCIFFFSNATLPLTSISFHTSFLINILRVCRYVGWWLRKGVWIESHCLRKTNFYEDRSRIVFSYVTSLFGFIPREKKTLFEIFLPLPTSHLSVGAQRIYFFSCCSYKLVQKIILFAQEPYEQFQVSCLRCSATWRPIEL